MVRIAREDTYATEDVGGGVLVRRLVKAGQPVPDHYDVDGETDPQAPARQVGYGQTDITAPVTPDAGADAAEEDPADSEPEPEATEKHHEPRRARRTAS